MSAGMCWKSSNTCIAWASEPPRCRCSQICNADSYGAPPVVSLTLYCGQKWNSAPVTAIVAFGVG